MAEVVMLKCRVHGVLRLISGIHFPEDVAPPDECPYCRTMRSGKARCGEGYLDRDSNGSVKEGYIVDEKGSLRKVSKLSEEKKRRILGRRKLMRGW